MELSEPDLVAAWKAGASVVLRDGDVDNLSVTIGDPLALAPDTLDRWNPRAIVTSADDVFAVANTIFPSSIAHRSANSADLYRRYLEIIARLRRRRGGFRAWGTYFERLTNFGTSGVNQLDLAISKLNTWPNTSKTGLVFHLSSPETDRPRTRGGPCWHFGELLCHQDGTIDFLAVYRNQDYFNKALGNFLGLAQLLNFICEQIRSAAGKTHLQRSARFQLGA